MNFEHGPSTIVTTDKGAVRGFKHNGIYHFYGLDYAFANRYEVPVECEPWEGVKEATAFGYICPPQKANYRGNHIKNPYRYWPTSDHCQNLNVWTRDLDPEKKKPVVFWLHGGGFADGSSIEHQAYDGFNLAKYHDLCVVTINHRLNCLGYLDLSSFGEKYARSANLGMLDIVKALEWVHRNIAAFGGDPNNVTIFGQSGGGGKVCTLLGMPAADGLYHRAMVMSGIGPKHGKDFVFDQRPIILRALEILGIKEEEIDKIETIDQYDLMQALMKADKEIDSTRLSLRPRKNVDFPGDPVLYGYSDYAKTVPVVVGGVFAEFHYQFGPDYDSSDLTDEDVMNILIEKYGKEKTEKVVPLFRKTFPEKKLYDFLNLEMRSFREGSKELIAARLRDNCAPIYNYLFAPTTGINESSTPVHSYEIPFFFHNTSIIPSNDLGGDATEKVELQCSERLANFARYGSPQLPGQIEWPACTKDCTPTLIIDDNTRIACNYDDEIFETLFGE
ncbi:MAG: carboxylesterase/lipase family protein [Erysipelotrichaceae bacterium]|nr:carboxylesterase/lipase family protein [Erysipelotrichaceae bacterium]